MRREIPLFLTFLFGLFFIVTFFFDTDFINFATEPVNDWVSIIIAFTYVLGLGNVLRIHSKKVARKEEGWPNSLATIAGVLGMLVFGILIWIPAQFAPDAGWAVWTGMQPGSVFNWFYDAVYTPMQSTMFALLAFFISSAAFRAFRVRSAPAAMLAITGLLLIVGGVSLGEAVWSRFPDFTSWIMEVLQNAGKRAILIGAALGAIATGVKI